MISTAKKQKAAADFVEPDGSHQRNGETGYYKDHGDSSEFVVSGEIIEEEIGEWHEIMTPGKHD